MYFANQCISQLFELINVNQIRILKKSRSQQERSRQMKDRLIEATLVCLQKYGYHGSSLTLILKEANVSRGAWNHHYSSKKDLVVDAAESILNYAIFRAKEVAHTLKSKKDFLFILDFIWKTFYTGRHRDVWIEFNVAARTDTELKERLLPILQNFHQSLDQVWIESLGSVEDQTDIRTLMNLTIYTLRGMALQSASYDKPEHYLELRKAWAQIIESKIDWK